MMGLKLCGDSDTEMLQFPDYWVGIFVTRQYITNYQRKIITV